jgi:hypothetical protein
MSEVYQRDGTRSRRKPIVPRGEVVSVNEAAVQLSLPIAEIIGDARAAVEGLMAEVGLLVMSSLIDAEATQIAGPRYAHETGRGAGGSGVGPEYVLVATGVAPGLCTQTPSYGVSIR